MSKPVAEDTATGDIAAFTTNRLGPRAKYAPSGNFNIMGKVDKDIKYLYQAGKRKKPDDEYIDRDDQESKEDKSKPKKKTTTP